MCRLNTVTVFHPIKRCFLLGEIASTRVAFTLIYILIVYILLVIKIIYKWPHLHIKT